MTSGTLECQCGENSVYESDKDKNVINSQSTTAKITGSYHRPQHRLAPMKSQLWDPC